jgi:hypothetical protein
MRSTTLAVEGTSRFNRSVSWNVFFAVTAVPLCVRRSCPDGIDGVDVAVGDGTGVAVGVGVSVGVPDD